MHPQDATTTEETGFAARLKAATAQRHSKAEHSTFMSDLMGGKLNLDAYIDLLSQYVYIYDALEAVARSYRAAGNDILEPFVVPGLDRLDAIKADLAALGEPLGRPATPATAEYAQRILATASNPERFLAHHYLRYLGDLSGGQAIAALVARHYGAAPEALNMYRFPELPKPKVYKDSYRDLLDNAAFTEEEREALIDEALYGFDANARVFAELGRQYVAA